MKWEEFLAKNPKTLIHLGEGHTYKWTSGKVGHFEDVGLPRLQRDGEEMLRVGIIENHRKADGMTCGGYAAVAKPLHPSEREAQAPKWAVVKFEPLTLHPSLLCDSCGSHGFIQEGRWVNAG